MNQTPPPNDDKFKVLHKIITHLANLIAIVVRFEIKERSPEQWTWNSIRIELAKIESGFEHNTFADTIGELVLKIIQRNAALYPSDREKWIVDDESFCEALDKLSIQ